MRVTSRSALVALLPALAGAVSLSDMMPRAKNLPDECDRIYQSQISGCGVPDFTTQSCTDTCVEALQAMVGPIKEACGGQGVTGQNLVVAFLANVGPQQICPNAPSSGGGSSSAAPEPSSTPSPTPSPTSTTETTPSETEASSKVQSTSLLVDTSSAAPVSTPTRTRTPAFSGTTKASSLTSITEEQSFAPTTSVDGPTTRTSSNEPTSTADSSEQNQQATAEDQSGGGSPFDEEGNMFSGADSLGSTSVLVSLGIAFVVVAFLFR